MAHLSLRELDKRFRGTHAVRSVTLDIHAGELIVLLGPSGCGKTTTLRMIAGLETPSSGRIELGGRDITRLSPADRDVAMVFQFYALYPHLSVRENIAFPLEARGLPRGEINARVARVVERLGVREIAERRPSQLSGGDQQRVAIARAMVRQPAAFLMDEPLSTLDARQREAMREEIRRLHLELHATTVFVTHDQLEAMSLADRIAVMNQGVVEQFDTPHRVYHHPATLFVARFIGAPAMNMLAGSTRSFSGVGGAATLELLADGCDWRIPIPGHVLAGQADVPHASSQSYSGSRRLVCCVRPEHVRALRPGEPDPARSGGIVSPVGSIIHAEHLGSHVVADVALGECTLKLRASQVPASVGQPVRLAIEAGDLRWFDADTSRALQPL